MSRKNPSAADLLVLAPWWVSAILGAVLYVALKWIVPHFAATASNPFYKAFGTSIPSLAPMAAIFCAALAVMSAIFARRQRKLVDSQTSLESLKSINWQEFEWLVGEAFRRQGYAVEVGLTQGADGGVDVVLRKSGKTTIVQCKHRKSSSVSVPVVRELFGVMTAEKADAAIVITTGTFTRDAYAFAAGRPLQLIDGDQLLALVKSVQKGSSIADSENQPVHNPSAVTLPSRTVPSCPKCGAAMARRTARRGANAGNQFWGCSTYPKCHAVVN